MKTAKAASKPIVALVVIVIALASALGYSAYSFNAAVAAENARVNQLGAGLASLRAAKTTTVGQPKFNQSQPRIGPVSIYQDANASVVMLQGSKATTVSTFFGQQQALETVLGSGFVIAYHNSYYIATNFHVVDGVNGITATFWNGDAYPAKVVGSDPYSDLAIVSSSAPLSELHPLQLTS
ncbi:MAG: trypsin-like peptidase domain-containing protein [Nitrososphaerota archaeon]|nr:trypsin-like peptidase domain-containing protein [Nitrososphaerota archaeon]